MFQPASKQGQGSLLKKIQTAFRNPATAVESFLNQKEFDYYLSNFKDGGMNGPLNYYRTTKHRFDEEVGTLPDRFPSSLPVLFLWGDQDATCSPNQVKRMGNFIPSLQVVLIPGKGHWLMTEAADDVVNNVAAFVQGIGSKQNAKL